MILASTRSGIEHQRAASALFSRNVSKIRAKGVFLGRAKFEPNTRNITTLPAICCVNQGLYRSRTRCSAPRCRFSGNPSPNRSRFSSEPKALSLMKKCCVKVDRKNKQFGSTLTQSIVGDSAHTRQLLQLIRSIAPTAASVLINGESGAGKELIAKPYTISPIAWINPSWR